MHTLKRVLPTIIIVLFTTISINAVSQDADKVTVEELKQHIYFLASDSLEGREPGTEGGKIAGEYIRDNFISAGLKPIGDDGFQYFKVTTSVEPGNGNKLTFNDVEGVFNTDFKVMPFSSNTTITAPIVFAGYGFDIDHDSLKWNDYNDVDVEGKWVMVLRGDPEPDNDTSLFISFAGDRDKLLTARDYKAAGIIYVNGVKNSSEDKLIGESFNRVTASAGLPAINITRNIADKMLGENTIEAVEKEIMDNKKPKGFNTDITLTATTDLQRVEVETQNVVAIIEGSDPVLKDEYIVIGAHYDHLGFGGHGSGSRMPDTMAVHNGADDNASGVAAVIELAEKLNLHKKKLKRSVVLMAFGAEEMGLLGSQFFTNEPLIDLKDIVLMVNFDMVGRFDNEKRVLTISGTGTAEEMEELLTRHEEKTDIKFSHSPEGYGASDHASFYGAGIPVMFFFTGAHEDYHTPYDDADKINYEGEKEIVDFAYDVIVDVINNDDRLTYKESGPKQNNTGRGRNGLKVKFGIMPDFTSTENDGLGVGGVTPGGPAAIAGMLKGDKIVAIEGLPVTNIYDYMARLKKLKPGQRISVDVVRNGEKVILMILL